jgi:hypothetical protein
MNMLESIHETALADDWSVERLHDSVQHWHLLENMRLRAEGRSLAQGIDGRRNDLKAELHPIFCKCGCGQALGASKLKDGNLFVSSVHYRRCQARQN